MLNQTLDCQDDPILTISSANELKITQGLDHLWQKISEKVSRYCCEFFQKAPQEFFIPEKYKKETLTAISALNQQATYYSTKNSSHFAPESAKNFKLAAAALHSHIFLEKINTVLEFLNQITKSLKQNQQESLDIIKDLPWLKEWIKTLDKTEITEKEKSLLKLLGGEYEKLLTEIEQRKADQEKEAVDLVSKFFSEAPTEALKRTD